MIRTLLLQHYHPAKPCDLPLFKLSCNPLDDLVRGEEMNIKPRAWAAVTVVRLVPKQCSLCGGGHLGRREEGSSGSAPGI